MDNHYKNNVPISESCEGPLIIFEKQNSASFYSFSLSAAVSLY